MRLAGHLVAGGNRIDRDGRDTVFEGQHHAVQPCGQHDVQPTADGFELRRVRQAEPVRGSRNGRVHLDDRHARFLDKSAEFSLGQCAPVAIAILSLEPGQAQADNGNASRRLAETQVGADGSVAVPLQQDLERVEGR